MEKTVLLAGVAGLMAFSIIQQPTEKLLFREPVKTESQVQPAKPATQAQPGKHVTPVQPGKPATPVLKESKALLPVTAKPESVYLVPAVKVVPGVAVPDTVPNNPVSPENKNNFPNISSSTNDDGQTKTTRIEATDQTGKKYKINKINDKITELYVDGVAIPENQFNKYNDVIEQIEDQRHTNALVARKRLEEVRRKNLIEREVRTKEREVRLKEDRAVRSQELQEKRLKVEKERNARATQERAVRKTILVNNATNREISSIINELTSAKVIEDRDNLSFSLNNESLVVNGKKQPSELHEKLRGKYIQKSGDKYIYSKKGNTTNVTINKE